jgi:hypothetical protein
MWSTYKSLTIQKNASSQGAQGQSYQGIHQLCMILSNAVLACGVCKCNYNLLRMGTRLPCMEKRVKYENQRRWTKGMRPQQKQTCCQVQMHRERLSSTNRHKACNHYATCSNSKGMAPTFRYYKIKQQLMGCDVPPIQAALTC